jgi:hypothetical protein
LSLIGMLAYIWVPLRKLPLLDRDGRSGVTFNVVGVPRVPRPSRSRRRRPGFGTALFIEQYRHRPERRGTAS